MADWLAFWASAPRVPPYEKDQVRPDPVRHQHVPMRCVLSWNNPATHVHANLTLLEFLGHRLSFAHPYSVTSSIRRSKPGGWTSRRSGGRSEHLYRSDAEDLCQMTGRTRELPGYFGRSNKRTK